MMIASSRTNEGPAEALSGLGRLGKGVALALLATLAHLDANVGDQEHTEEAPSDDLKVEHVRISSGELERCFYRLVLIQA
jgi:hypothetical protein